MFLYVFTCLSAVRFNGLGLCIFTHCCIFVLLRRNNKWIRTKKCTAQLFYHHGSMDHWQSPTTHWPISVSDAPVCFRTTWPLICSPTHLPPQSMQWSDDNRLSWDPGNGQNPPGQNPSRTKCPPYTRTKYAVSSVQNSFEKPKRSFILSFCRQGGTWYLGKSHDSLRA